MFICVLFAFVYGQMQDEQQLTNAACVVSSRYYLQQNQQKVGPILGEIIQSQGLTKEDAIMYTLASLVESCLDGITKSETMEIIQSLQTQQLDLERHNHLFEGVDLKKYGSKKKSSKKNEMLKVIKQIDDIIMQQKKEHEGDDGGSDPQQQDQNKKRQRNPKKQSSDLPNVFIFETREWLVLSSFALVGVLLIYIIFCIPEKKKDKKQKKKTIPEEETKKEDNSEGEIVESKEKPKSD